LFWRSSPCLILAIYCGLALAIAVRGAALAPPSETTTSAFAQPQGGVIFLPPLISNFVLTTRAADRLVATSPAGRSVLRREIISQVYPALRDLPFASDNAYIPNLELMVAERPAVIFASTRSDEIQRTGLSVADLASNQGAERMARLFLKGLGKDGEIATAIHEFHAKFASLDDELSTSCAADRKPRVLILGIFSDADLISGGALSPLNETIVHAGGANALANMHVNVARLDPEELLLLNPDVIVFGEGVYARGVSPLQIMDNPRFRSLGAVAQKRVYQQPNMWSVPNSIIESPIYARWLAELLHACLSAKARKMVADAYLAATGQAVGDDLIDDTLSVAPNLGAARGSHFTRGGAAD
jgi:ABC-type Fe3+-hydroxamate transport system substrate-binding protein